MDPTPAQQIAAILRGIRRSAKNASTSAQKHTAGGDVYSAVILSRTAAAHDSLAQQCEALLIAAQTDELTHSGASSTSLAMVKRARQLQQKSRDASASARENLRA